jgi:hypothetical protein
MGGERTHAPEEVSVFTTTTNVFTTVLNSPTKLIFNGISTGGLREKILNLTTIKENSLTGSLSFYQESLQGFNPYLKKLILLPQSLASGLYDLTINSPTLFLIQYQHFVLTEILSGPNH